MKIECALALQDARSYGESLSIESDTTFEVVFNQRSTALYLSCQEAEISVQSVRWPVTRFTKLYKTGNGDETDLSDTCQARGTCNLVDATVWVTPICTSSANRVPEVCVQIFKDASCFPYCLAARRAGSAADGLILYSALDWKDKVHIVDRDCGATQLQLLHPLAAVQNNSATYLAASAMTPADPQTSEQRLTSVDTVTLNDILQGTVRLFSWNATKGCQATSQVRSIVGVQAHPGYTFPELGSKTQTRRFPSLLMPGQPFAFAGDTTLTAVKDGQGRYFVAIDRLYGNEANDFTMVNVQSQFPAHNPADTIALGGNEYDSVGYTDKLPTPYAYADMAGVRHPAVSTVSAVFFAVNPSLAMFRGFASGCITNGTDWQLQLSALSSYAPIRVWAINPYVYCPRGDDGTVACGPGNVKFATIPDAFTDLNQATGKSVFNLDQCTRSFSVAVTNLEYINEENVAVTVLRAPFSEYDANTGLLYQNATVARFDIC